jgi:CRISP-associated protein Cas1
VSSPPQPEGGAAGAASLARGLGTSALDVPALVPARMINEVLFCERLLYLEWAQSEWADNAFTVEGNAVHRRSDEPKGALPDPDRAADRDADGDEGPAEALPYRATSVWLSSDELGLTAKIDVVEGEGDGPPTPIEYKRGKIPDVPGQAYLPERAQIGAQLMLLQASGYATTTGALYFAGSKRRVPVVLDDELRAVVESARRRAREIVASGRLPAPLVGSPKCGGCSLAAICLPDELTHLTHSRQPVIASPEDGIRRLTPARDDRVPLHVQAQGGRVGLSGDELDVVTKGSSQRVRISNTSAVSLYGNVQLTTQAARALLDRGVPVAFFSFGGWFQGLLSGLPTKNIELRVAQTLAVRDPAFALRMTRGVVAAKIRNQRTLLRRNAEALPAWVLGELEILATKAETEENLPSLLGLEGAAARLYFQELPRMIRDPQLSERFDREGRTRRPPRDPVNAMLSFAYALLAKDLHIALALAGLEPMLGFYHQPRFGRASLALDLMEELRPILADSTVLQVVNTGEIDARDFLVRGNAANLSPSGRKKLLQAYERRLDQLMTHPVFGYRVSYRRALEIQARLFGRLVLGEIDAYPHIRTR